MPKTSNEVQGFMDRERLASFATVDSANSPHVVPVFFTCEDGKVFVQCDRNSVKVRNLAGNPSVAIAVYSGEEAVVIRGKGHVSTERNLRRERETTYRSIIFGLANEAGTRWGYPCSIAEFAVLSKSLRDECCSGKSLSRDLPN